MFTCPLHQWASHELPCPACQKSTSITSSDTLIVNLGVYDESESPAPAGDKTAEEKLSYEVLLPIVERIAYEQLSGDQLGDLVKKMDLLANFIKDFCAPLSARIAELERTLKAATALLEELGEYMEARADTVDGENIPRPNTEMCYSQSINDMLGKISGGN